MSKLTVQPGAFMEADAFFFFFFNLSSFLKEQTN